MPSSPARVGAAPASGPAWRTQASAAAAPSPHAGVAPARPPVQAPAQSVAPPAAGPLGATPISTADPREDPLVKDIIELFHAKVIHVEKKSE